MFNKGINLTDTEFLDEATNVYRTKDFIVKQKISISLSDSGNDILMSHDTYYKRTSKLDGLYEKVFSYKGKEIDGKRMRTSAFVRKYM